nr:MAG TPA: hypothetical protein [Caudoviricetes sp.]
MILERLLREIVKTVLELLFLIAIQYGVGALVMEAALVQKNQLIILLV